VGLRRGKDQRGAVGIARAKERDGKHGFAVTTSIRWPRLGKLAGDRPTVIRYVESCNETINIPLCACWQGSLSRMSMSPRS